MNIYTLKWIILTVLFILTFIFSMLPLKLMSKLRNTENPQQHSRYECIVGLLSCFAAGVFMGTGLLDLFPEVNELLNQAKISQYMKASFPVAEFAVSFGFLLVLILEQIVKEYKSQHSSPSVEEERKRSEPHSTQDVHQTEQSVDIDEPGASDFNAELHPRLRSIFLLFALSLHSLFEGLAIGLQPDINDVIQIFIAVIIHKVIIAFSLGLNLVQTDLSVSAIIKSNFLFSITSPLGIGIAIGVEEFGENVRTSILNGILQGLACGTFIYVTFFEILPHELAVTKHRMFKLLALILGFSMVCLVLFLDPSEAAHSIKP